jgi:uncharacterized protein (TIGR03083 family)
VSPDPPPPTSLDFVQEYAGVAARFAEAVRSADLGAPVRACPGWSTRDLVVHLGNTHSWAATIVETGRSAPDPDDEPASRTARGVAAWYLAKAEDLYRVLQDAPPDRPCWNFASGDGVTAFWPRRQLHETTIHLVDLEEAAAAATDVSAEVAADGVDEVLTVMMLRMHRRGCHATLSAPVQVRTLDTGHSWVVHPSRQERADPPPPAVERGGDGVADRVEATADVLYRTLWHRQAGPVSIGGDQARVRAFLGSRLTP